MQGPKFGRTIDQELFDALSQRSPDFLKAQDWLKKGADVNAACIHPDIGNTFMAVALFEEFTGQGDISAELGQFILDNGFDPRIQNGLNGAHALTYLITYSRPSNELFSVVKRFLERGCNPKLPFLNYTDETELESAFDRTSGELFDSWMPEHDFLKVQGFAPLYQLLAVASHGGRYQSVEPVTSVLGKRIESISGLGATRLQTIVAGSKWRYEGEWKADAFSSGIVIGCEDKALCIDPYQAAFCSTDIKTAPGSEKLAINSKIVAITGRVSDYFKEGGFDDTFNIILENGYCLRIQEDPDNAAGYLKRGRILYKLISDELSEAFSNCEKL